MLVVVAVLYFARTVIIPVVLAILLAFLLAPLVVRLRRLGLGRVLSSLVVVTFTFVVVGLLTALMAMQLSDLAHKLPEYQENVDRKLDSIRSSGGGVLNRVTRVIHRFTDELVPTPPASDKVDTAGEKPVPVEIRRAPFSPLEVARKVLGSVVTLVVMIGIVIVFALFILMQREDLRDRVIRLAGAGRVHVTTKVLDDAAHRVSRFLIAQLVLNAGYGFLVGLGLWAIGVPNPLLWAIISGILRYVPYLGIWVGGAMPALLAFAVEPGWTDVFLVIGLFAGVDLLLYNLAEPVLYGSSTGTSPLAILVAAVFWTWLWGPVGLLLSTPLTVCVVVLGRHVPGLEFLSVLLGDEPVLRPHTRFYQRMLAMDFEEATEMSHEFITEKPLDELYDQVLIPALSLCEEDRHRGRLDERRESFLMQHTRMLVDDLGEVQDGAPDGEVAKQVILSAVAAATSEEIQVTCVPARDDADAIAATMLTQLLRRRQISARALASGSLAGESVEQISQGNARLICVCCVPPFGYMHARYICRRLRAQFPDLKIVAAVLTEGPVEEVKQRQPPLRADEIVASLKQAIDAVVSLLPAAQAQAPKTEFSPPEPRREQIIVRQERRQAGNRGSAK